MKNGISRNTPQHFFECFWICESQTQNGFECEGPKHKTINCKIRWPVISLSPAVLHLRTVFDCQHPLISHFSELRFFDTMASAAGEENQRISSYSLNNSDNIIANLKIELSCYY